MNFPRSILRPAGFAAIAVAVVLTLAGPPAANAKPDPGGPILIQSPATAPGCPLTRIDTQLVHCDSLTGAGASAPVWVPEQ